MASHIASHSSQPQRFCKYIHRYCNQTRLEGYDYCIRHILEDKSAPFKQCMYVNQPNRKRCTNAAPKNEKSERRDNLFCPFHAKRAMLKVRISAPKKRPVEGPASFLKYLEHYCRDPNHDPSHKRESVVRDKSDVVFNKGCSPTSLSDLEGAFDNEVPVEAKSRIESVDDELCWVEKTGDYLEHAGVFTHKEVLTIAREKILRLQQLYCEELEVVYHQLRESRRQFLTEVRNLNQPGSSAVPQFAPDQAKKAYTHALMQYHHHSGAEKILRHKIQSKRLNLDKTTAVQTCSYDRKGKLCKNAALFPAKFCKSHILLDPKQLLFKACPFGVNKKCKQPVLVFDEDGACDLHLHRLLKSKLSLPSSSSDVAAKTFQIEPEPFFHAMDDIASLGLDVITPGSLFGLDQYGEPGESTDTVMSEDPGDTDLMPISMNPPADILSDSRKSESDECVI